MEYETYTIGKDRKIDEPDDELRDKQKSVLHMINQHEYMKPSYFDHAFLKARNTATLAKQHVGKKIIIRMDIRKFFNSITFKKFLLMVGLKRNLNLFKFLPELCYSFRPYNVSLEEYISHVKDILKSDAYFEESSDNVDSFSLDLLARSKIRKFRKLLKRGAYLPQGGITSPRLSNIYMYGFDWILAWILWKMYKKNGTKIIYNRYADDMFLSADKEDKCIWGIVKHIRSTMLPNWHLEENRSKFHVMRDGKRKQVCGLIVNEKLNLPRELRKKIRAIKHNKKVENREYTDQEKGLLAYEEMVYANHKKVQDNIDLLKAIEVRNRL